MRSDIILAAIDIYMKLRQKNQELGHYIRHEIPQKTREIGKNHLELKSEISARKFLARWYTNIRPARYGSLPLP